MTSRSGPHAQRHVAHDRSVHAHLPGFDEPLALRPRAEAQLRQRASDAHRATWRGCSRLLLGWRLSSSASARLVVRRHARKMGRLRSVRHPVASPDSREPAKREESQNDGCCTHPRGVGMSRDNEVRRMAVKRERSRLACRRSRSSATRSATSARRGDARALRETAGRGARRL